MRLGCHVYRAPGHHAGLHEHIEAARVVAEDEGGVTLGAVQVFVGGPRERKIIVDPGEQEALRGYFTRTGLFAVAHNAYNADPWRGDPDAARFIREEAEVCQAAGIRGLVVHLPRLPVAAVAKYARRLVEAKAPDVRIYLETPAVTPKETYYDTPKKLAALFEALALIDPEKRTFGLCVDTAHLWVNGIDVGPRAVAASWLAALERGVVGKGWPVMIHANDSQRLRGTGPDAHAPLAEGHIWGEYRDNLGDSGLAAFVDFAQKHSIPVILERKPGDLRKDYLLLRKLV